MSDGHELDSESSRVKSRNGKTASRCSRALWRKLVCLSSLSGKSHLGCLRQVLRLAVPDWPRASSVLQ